MTIRFIHTSDWQLGLKLAYIPEKYRARAQEARFTAVEQIGELAREHDVQAVVVAGDVFDDNAVGRDVLQKAVDAMGKMGDCPVLLLPGNHDPATPDSAMARLAARDNIHVLDSAEPFEAIDGAVFYPCPLTSRNPGDDPTAWIPADASASPGAIRVAIVHGSALDLANETESGREVDTKQILSRGMDYVAMGDWHSKKKIDDRVWYSGAPEATRFKEIDPGYVLLVEIDGPGALPRVTPIPVARTGWIKEERSLDSTDDLDAFESWLKSLTEPSWKLLQLRLDGGLSYADLNRLDELLEEAEETLLWLLKLRLNVKPAPTEADLARLRGEGFVGEAVEVLWEQVQAAAEAEKERRDEDRPEQGGGDLEEGADDSEEGADDSEEGADDSEESETELAVAPDVLAAQDALRLLYRFMNTEEAK